jgi:hypothetical protein
MSRFGVTLKAQRVAGCLAQRPISQALFLGNVTNATRDDCVWRRGGGRDACPDPDVRFYFYSRQVQTYLLLRARKEEFDNYVYHPCHVWEVPSEFVDTLESP